MSDEKSPPLVSESTVSLYERAGDALENPADDASVNLGALCTLAEGHMTLAAAAATAADALRPDDSPLEAYRRAQETISKDVAYLVKELGGSLGTPSLLSDSTLSRVHTRAQAAEVLLPFHEEITGRYKGLLAGGTLADGQRPAVESLRNRHQDTASILF